MQIHADQHPANNTTSYHLPTDAQPNPKQWLPMANSAQQYGLPHDVRWYGTTPGLIQASHPCSALSAAAASYRQKLFPAEWPSWATGVLPSLSNN